MLTRELTRDEARERAALLDVHSYDIALDLTGGEETFLTTTVLRFTARRPGRSTFADLVASQIREISINGRALEPADVYAGNRIRLDDLEASNELRVIAECAYTNTGEGLHRMVDPADGKVYLYTQFEVPDARRVFANFEQPDLKATFTFTVTAPSHWTVVSNSTTPAPEPTGEGVATWRFEPTPRIPTYVTAVVAGDYHIVHDSYTSASGRVVPMAVGCRASLSGFLDAKDIFDVTKQGFEYFLRIFECDYPFAKYDQMLVPEYNAGAMENAACVTLSEDRYLFRSKEVDAAYARRADTILHELAHMWFGDLVTPAWWDDVWLKESFATYAAMRCRAEATRWTNTWSTFASTTKAWAYRQDQLSSTHPIAADIRELGDVRVNFDGITYAKGASVLKQLVAWVGTDAFSGGMRQYFRRHTWGNATLSDLLKVLEETSGRDLSSWSKLWLEAAGPNTLRPEFTTSSDGAFASFAVLQEAPAEYPTLRPHRIGIGLYNLTGGTLTRSERIEVDIAGGRTDTPQLVGRPRPDLVLLNDDDLTYAKIRFDQHSWATLVGHIGGFASPLARTLCWTAAWDMVRNAEIPARDYVRLVLSGIGEETDSGEVQILLQQATSAVELYTDPGWRPTGRRMLAAASHQRLESAAAGSDLQLLWVRSLAATADTDEQFAVISGLLDGSITPHGLNIDTDLRWSLLLALVIADRAGEAEIGAELDRDKTADGQRHAAAARAALPLKRAKEAAWNAILYHDDAPNAIRASVISGFRSVSAQNRDLLRPFVGRYFGSLNEIWESRSPETAKSLITGLYPGLLVEQDILDRTDSFLATGNPPSVLRRLLLESRDELACCLNAQTLDAAENSLSAGSGFKSQAEGPVEGSLLIRPAASTGCPLA